jgi:hypothetical protein
MRAKQCNGVVAELVLILYMGSAPFSSINWHTSKYADLE